VAIGLDAAPLDLRQTGEAVVFEALGQGTFPMGTATHAALAKLVGNFMLAATIEMLGEGIALAEQGGMDSGKLVEMLAGTIFGSAVVKGYGPRIARTEFEPPGFTLRLGLKDVALALEAADELKVAMPLASLARDHLLASLAKGREGWDFAGLAAVARDMAGLPPRR